MSEARLQREAQFHNKAFSEKTRATVGKFYAVARASKQLYHELLLQNCAAKRVLEYGCGAGSRAYDLGRAKAAVTGIDIADGAIAMAKEKAAAEGLSDLISFEVMNAEALNFAKESFDLVCGSGILHHLDLKKALSEIGRVVKPDGRVVFYEPLGHNAFINLYRRLTPNLRTPDEHPLRREDLKLLYRFFDQVELRYFHFFSLFAVPLHAFPGFAAVLGTLDALDRLLFRVPFFKKQAWVVVIQLSRPKLDQSS